MNWFNSKPVEVNGCEIHINTNKAKNNIPIEHIAIICFQDIVPIITVYENKVVIAKYKVEPIDANPDLRGQYLHISIRILDNFALMIDGIISKEKMTSQDRDFFEGIRFQPLFLSQSRARNELLQGKGLFERGLHFNGIITPSSVRLSCICDYCKESFNLQSFHAGFQNLQYFYSDDGMQTLVVNTMDKSDLYIPGQLQERIDIKKLTETENRLPSPTVAGGKYKYYNSLRCPYCSKPYIDFEHYPQIRPFEYYGNVFANKKVQKFE